MERRDDRSALILISFYFVDDAKGKRTSHIYAEATSNTRHWASRDPTSSGTRIITDLSHEACSSRPRFEGDRRSYRSLSTEFTRNNPPAVRFRANGWSASRGSVCKGYNRCAEPDDRLECSETARLP